MESRVLHGVDTEHGGGRIISLVHRVKETTKGESRPTTMAVMDPATEEVKIYKLEKEEDEVALAYGIFVTRWRDVEEADDVGTVPGYAKRTWGRRTQIAASYEGVRRGDTVITTLGGSGLYLNYGLAFLAERVGAQAMAIATNRLAEARNGAPKTDDVVTIAHLYLERPDLFYQLSRGNRVYMEVTYAQRLFDKAQKTRIAAEQRVYQQVTGEIFMSDRDIFPFESLREAKELAAEKSDTLQALFHEEERAKKQLEHALHKHPGATYFFAIEGIGPSIAGRILGPIGDPIRFVVMPDMEKISELRREAENLKERGGFAEEAMHITPTREVVREGSGERHEKKLSHTELLVATAIRLRGRGEKTRAQCLSDAVRVYGEISLLLDRAAERSAGKMVAYCGAHVLPDGTFPRRKRGKTAPVPKIAHDSNECHDGDGDDFPEEENENNLDSLDEREADTLRVRTNNWSTKARQAVWNLADQFIKRAHSYWGLRYRTYKERFLARHEGDEAWSAGRVHRKALWRTRTRLLQGCCKKWCRDVIRGEVTKRTKEIESEAARNA